MTTTSAHQRPRHGLGTLAEIDPNCSPLTAHCLRRLYVHGPGIDEPLAMWSSDTVPGSPFSVLGSWNYFHADHLGSITEITDAQGNIAAQYRYSAYGSVSLNCLAADCSLLTAGLAPAFTGRPWDSEARLSHYRFRWYDPEVGRFIGEDPLAAIVLANWHTDPGGASRIAFDPGLWYPYAYPHLNPVLFLDPLGLEGCSRLECLGDVDPLEQDDWLELTLDLLSSATTFNKYLSTTLIGGTVLVGGVDVWTFICGGAGLAGAVLGGALGESAAGVGCAAVQTTIEANEILDHLQECLSCPCP